MKLFARTSRQAVSSSVALAKEETLCRLIFVSSLVREGRGNGKGEVK